MSGREIFSIEGIQKGLKPLQKLMVKAQDEKGEKSFEAIVRIDTPDEVEYYCHGGILQYVLRQLI